MNDWKKVLILGGAISLSCAFPVMATTNLETGSSLAGISVALNNYYAGNKEPEKQLAADYPSIQSRGVSEASQAGGASGEKAASQGTSSGEKAASQGTASGETAAGEKTAAPEENPEEKGAAGAASAAKQSSYDNIAVSRINGTVNIRTEANTSSNVTGKINNDCAATILDTVEGEGGKWYKIKSGSVTGYIKAEYFVTGKQAEEKAKEVGTTYGTVVGTSSLRLRENPDLTGKTLTLLAEGAQYTVIGEEGDFLKVAIDSDLEGYVFKDYMATNVSFKEAISLEEEREKEEEEKKRREEAEKALKALEEAKRAEKEKKTTAASQKETQAETKPEKKEETSTAAAIEAATSKAETKPEIQTIPVNPEQAEDVTVPAPPTEAPTEKPTEKETQKETTSQKGPGGPGSDKQEDSGSSSSVTSATRNAIVAYAKQFLGNPYVYGGTSLTNGADCSGFTMSVYAHFGISTGRSSRDQAARGKAIPVGDVKPGDLLFYASGDYINHVGIYIGGGQIIHASNPSTGICLAPSNYRTPCKAVTFLD